MSGPLLMRYPKVGVPLLGRFPLLEAFFSRVHPLDSLGVMSKLGSFRHLPVSLSGLGRPPAFPESEIFSRLN